MRIAVIGAGRVGGTLGRRWARHGHDVTFCVRDPAAPKIRSLLAATDGKATAAAAAGAAEHGDVVVLTTPFDSARSALEAAGNLQGKVVVDCTNPLGPGLAGLAVEPETSGAEELAKAAPGALLVKAFNTTGSANMEDPVFADGSLTMFICGDDEPAKETVAQLARDLGFEPADVGPLRAAYLLECLALLWIRMAYEEGHGQDFGFRVLRRR